MGYDYLIELKIILENKYTKEKKYKIKQRRD